MADIEMQDTAPHAAGAAESAPVATPSVTPAVTPIAGRLQPIRVEGKFFFAGSARISC